MTRFVVPALSAVLVLSACGGGGGDGTNYEFTYHRDVAPLIADRCLGCHTNGNIAPFALTSYDEVYAQRELVQLNVNAGTMPPWLPGDDCAEYVGNPSLSDEDKRVIDQWVKDGAPEGDPKDARQSLEGDPETRLERVDLTVEMPGEYLPVRAPDDYRCFVLEWPETTTKYVTGYRVVPGNPKVVHHVIAFAYSAASADIVRQMDADEPGEGYTCFGDAGGPYEDLTTLGAWAPGGTDKRLPPGIGIRMDPGAVVVLQVHYNVLTTDPEPDLSAIELSLEDTVEREGAILWWTNFQSWIGGNGMRIPAGEAGVKHSFSFDPTPYMPFITNAVPANQPFVIHSASLHMHQLGVRGIEKIEKADGTDECLLDVPEWDFNWQDSYGFKVGKVFEPGDSLYIECEWDNTPERQSVVDGERLPPRDVYWGDGTQDEMCLGVFLISE